MHRECYDLFSISESWLDCSRNQDVNTPCCTMFWRVEVNRKTDGVCVKRDLKVKDNFINGMCYGIIGVITHGCAY